MKKISESLRRKIRREFTQWRIALGKEINDDESPLSYNQIVEIVNAHAGGNVLRYSTVASWGTAGHVPRDLAAPLRNAFASCPLLKY